ncbi:phage portal protein [Microbispora sp. KK1-11]|uniref:phage portal protein n=1 Tax=Microbispora sp. KK1-11 TaxID=2053005 RepID=UPI00115979F9|nr:phage portal protein [Microbispora sp. KK1-11]TQS30036.1 phage portal protein [Microbispora sp. KK1-11]
MIEDLIPAYAELRAARPAYDQAEMYREGDAPEKFPSSDIQRLLKGGSQDFHVNLAARPVDAVLDRLEIAAVVCEPDEHTATLMEQVWEPNELDIEAPQIHDNALTYGDAYLFVWPSDSSSDADEQGEPVAHVDGVHVFYNSPLSVRVIYDEENPRLPRLVIKAWCEGVGEDKRTRVNLYYADHFEKWVTKKDSGKKSEDALTGEDFEPFVDDFTDENGHIPNEYGRIPFFHFRTHRPYGRPVHKNAYGPQDALTKLITNQMAASDFAAFPQRYGLLDPGASEDDDLDWGDDTESDPEDRPSQMVAAPGSMWILRNYKSVGQFAPADPDAFLKPQGQFMRLMAATTTTPMRWFDPSGDTPSGESIRADDAPLVKRIGAYQRAFGATWKDALEFALRILGFDAKVTIQWAPAQTTGDLEYWQAVQAKQDAGVPVRQTLLEAGYTDAQVTGWGYTEDQPNGEGGFDQGPEPQLDLAPLPEVVPPLPVGGEE